jgi:hypothetical protein
MNEKSYEDHMQNICTAILRIATVLYRIGITYCIVNGDFEEIGRNFESIYLISIRYKCGPIAKNAD